MFDRVSVTRFTDDRENGSVSEPLPAELSGTDLTVSVPSARLTMATAPEMPEGPLTESRTLRDPVRLEPAVNA